MPDRTCSRGHHDKTTSGVCPTCKRIALEEDAPIVEYEMPTPTADSHGADIFPEGEW